MPTNFRKIAFTTAALLGLAVSLPSAPSWAASPNNAGSQLAEMRSSQQNVAGPYDPSGPARGTGIYDNYDRYKDARGFPLPGYAPLFEPAD
jgi:hypothetical protein